MPTQCSSERLLAGLSQELVPGLAGGVDDMLVVPKTRVNRRGAGPDRRTTRGVPVRPVGAFAQDSPTSTGSAR
jgi:hypothetical protein